MPLYTYLCPCGRSFTINAPIKDSKEHKCPDCGAIARRSYTQQRVALRFMGNGWPDQDRKKEKE